MPKGIPVEYLHKNVVNNDNRARATRYNEPIITVKPIEPTESMPAYQRVHVSFQSTGATNFSTVNCLNAVQNSVQRKERGRDEHKHVWAIKGNEAHFTYLNLYCKIDVIDHLIKNCNIGYKTWKYWHSGMNHAFAFGVVSAHDMYLEVASGVLNPAWKVNKPMSLHKFIMRLSEQMMAYDAANAALPSDTAINAYTKLTQQQRVARENQQQRRKRTAEDAGLVTLEQLEEACTEPATKDGTAPRLCADISTCRKHQKSSSKYEGGKMCKVCGEKAYTICGMCGAALHCKREDTCFLDYHDMFFLA